MRSREDWRRAVSEDYLPALGRVLAHMPGWLGGWLTATVVSVFLGTCGMLLVSAAALAAAVIKEARCKELDR